MSNKLLHMLCHKVFQRHCRFMSRNKFMNIHGEHRCPGICRSTWPLCSGSKTQTLWSSPCPRGVTDKVRRQLRSPFPSLRHRTEENSWTRVASDNHHPSFRESKKKKKDDSLSVLPECVIPSSNTPTANTDNYLCQIQI